MRRTARFNRLRPLPLLFSILFAPARLTETPGPGKDRPRPCLSKAIGATVCGLILLAAGHPLSAQEVLPRPDWRFEGNVGRTIATTAPQQWPKPVEAPAGAPNILVIMTDDVGFSASSTFGGAIPTPTFDELAKSGLRYNRFHTTALCSPTRSALLTGRNHHEVGMGVTEDQVTGYEGYSGVIPRSAGTIAEILRQNGFSTAAFGKWHLTPYVEMGPTGPFDQWPTNMGFEHFYGFLPGQTNQWHPDLVEGTKHIDPPLNDPGYILDRDLADHAIEWLQQHEAVEPNKPFFIYYATGSAHAPHHAPREWIEKFKGQFDRGWDALRQETLERQKKLGLVPPNTTLAPMPKGIPAWDSLDADHKAVYARMMEVWAAQLAHADYQIGRVVEAIRAAGKLDNTLVFYIQGDNGSSPAGGLQGRFNETTLYNGIAEDFSTVRAHLDELGGPDWENNYPIGWAVATDTPFKWFKQVASNFGGTRNGLVISWPTRIKDKGGIRTQFHHVVDIAPTLLEATGIRKPAILNGAAQRPMEGVSMVYTFDHPEAKSLRTRQYFEVGGNEALYQDGWVAATEPEGVPWVENKTLNFDDPKWTLYNVDDDFSESLDLAGKYPDRLHTLQDLFWVEAARNHALPIHSARVKGERPGPATGRSSFAYTAPIRLPDAVAPNTKNRSFSIAADVDVEDSDTAGMILSDGNGWAGYALYMLKARPVFCYNLAGLKYFAATTQEALAPGRHRIALEFKHNPGFGKGAVASLQVDGNRVGEVRIEQTIDNAFIDDSNFDVGEAHETPICKDYQLPFKFSGVLHSVTLDLK